MSVVAAVLGYKNPQLIHQILAQFGEQNIILIDNGSPEPLQFPVPTLRFHTNDLFTGGWQKAMRWLTGFDYVWMLNSDVLDISLEKMAQLYHWAEYHKMHIVSPTFNSPHRHMQPLHSKINARRVSWIDWTAPLVSTKWFWEMGGFDTNFKGYGADLDICYRARQLGNAEFFAIDSINIQHIGSVTAFNEGKMGEQGDNATMNRLFKEKYNIDDWSGMV
jgi:hypothetical protein